MSNYDKVVGDASGKVGFLAAQEDAAGSSANRFGIFLNQ